jgi:sec-independent protein translocase protein TatB
MFDITSSKLLILGVVALLVIGPKDLPALLRTIGKYVGIIRRHAADFRAQFEEAIRDSELDQLKKDVETIGTEAQSSLSEVEQTVNKEVAAAQVDVDAAMEGGAKPADPATTYEPMPSHHDAESLPIASTGGAGGTTAPLNGAGHAAEPAAASPQDTGAPAETQKSGA